MRRTLVKYFNGYSVIYMPVKKHSETAWEALAEQKLESIA